jgi:hypothetical protein
VTEQKPTTLTLNPHGGTYNYGTTVPFTAHLGHWDTMRNVTIMDRLAGSSSYYDYAAVNPVDNNGNLTTSLKLIQNTAVRAAYNGDAWDLPAIVDATVYVRANVSTSLSRQ